MKAFFKAVWEWTQLIFYVSCFVGVVVLLFILDKCRFVA